jgi:solute carrier family 30 (zinc transporter), member 2
VVSIIIIVYWAKNPISLLFKKELHIILFAFDSPPSPTPTEQKRTSLFQSSSSSSSSCLSPLLLVVVFLLGKKYTERAQHNGSKNKQSKKQATDHQPPTIKTKHVHQKIMAQHDHSSHGHGHEHSSSWSSCSHDTTNSNKSKNVVVVDLAKATKNVNNINNNNNNNNNNKSNGGGCSHNDNNNQNDTSRNSGAVSSTTRQNKAVLRRLYIATALCGTFFIVEIMGGWWSQSLAIWSDAAHLLADLCSFAVAIGAAHVAAWPSSEFHTYGLKRAESLAALLSMLTLAIVSLGLAYEAMRRLFFLAEPNVVVNGQLMSTVAAIGVVVNIVLAIVLGEHHTHMVGSDHHGCSSSHGHGGGGHDHIHGDHHHKKDAAAAGDSHDDNHTVSHSGGGCSGGHDHSSHNHHAKATTFLPAAAAAAATAAEVATTEHTALIVHHDHEVVPPEAKQQQQTQQQQQRRNVNLHAAYLHVMGDLAQSAAVLIAGIVIWWQPTWHVVDPICTLFFCTLVFAATIPVIRSSVAVLIEEVPAHVDWKAVHDGIENVNHVTGVHDLHIWSISHGVPGLSVHCFVQAGSSSSSSSSSNADAAQSIHQQALRDIHQVCLQHGISHVTIQAQLITSSSSSSSGGLISSSTTSATDTDTTTEEMIMEDCITCHENLASSCVQRSQIG